MLNASISFPRISLPGLDVMYLNGSSKAFEIGFNFFILKKHLKVAPVHPL